MLTTVFEYQITAARRADLAAAHIEHRRLARRARSRARAEARAARRRGGADVHRPRPALRRRRPSVQAVG